MRAHLAKYLLLLVCVLSPSTSAFGQNPVSYLNDTGSPAYATKVPVENGYIDLSNGNLHLEFPLASMPQRGTQPLTERLTYDSRIWNFTSGFSSHWWPQNVYASPYTSSGGWAFINGQSIGTLTGVPYESDYTDCYDDNGDYLGTDVTSVANLSYIDDSGTPHQTSATETIDDHGGCPDWSTTYTYGAGLSSDGSGYTVGVDGSGNPYVLDINGNEVYPNKVDRYGNYLSLNTSSIPYNTQDDTGRVPVIVTNHSSTVTYYDVLAPAGPISSSGTRVRYIVTTAPISVSTSFSQTGISEWSGTLDPVSSIQLPDGSSYTFTYDGYGELASVTLPTGGTISYAYTNFVDAMSTDNRWLYSRTVGSNPAETFTQAIVTTCSGSSVGCQQTVTDHKPNGDERVYNLTLDNGAWTTGIATYTGSATSGTHLTQTTSSYVFTNSCSYPCGSPSYADYSLTTTELFGSGSPIYTQTLNTFDLFSGKPLSTKQWDFTGSASTTTPPSGTPTRETDYAYTGAYSYVLPQDIYTVMVKDSTGAQAGLTTYGYTSSATSTSGVTQHGSPLITPQYLHTLTKWSNTAAPSPVTTYSMDDTGQVLSVQDPDGHSPSTITYQCANSLPYHATNSLSQQTAYGYDCASGAITGVQDPNDIAASRAGTTYTYESSAGRPYTISYPDGGSTTYSYISSTEVDATVAETGTTSITTKSYIDSYGRASQTSQNGVSSETSYDVNGRMHCVTNPHLSSGSPTDGSTCVTSYDGLDRPLDQQQPDGVSTLQWTYSQNTGTSTDEAGSQTQRTNNALGLLTSVVEVGPSGNLTTNYTYDGLGNLTKINQLGNGTTDSPRVRTFDYDSLSRLLCASNPENSSAACPGSVGVSYAYTAGTVGYGYDPNGNITSVKDARSITVTNTYDALNRLLTKSASGINYQYTYDTKTGLPNANSIGRLVYAWNGVTGTGAAAEGFSYDTMGRLNWEKSWTPSTWTSGGNLDTASYDEAGNMTDFTYPDGHHIQQSFNASGQLAGVNYADWGGTTVNYPYVSSIAYSPLGGMSSIILGNGVNESISYNNRAQPCEIAASYPVTPGGSTLAFASDKQYYFTSAGTGGVCGAVSSNNGNVWQIDDALNSTGKKQSFSFDSLNRLTGGVRADSAFNYTYNIDSFGNMQQQNNLISNPPISFPGTSNQLQVALGYSYDAAGNLEDTGSATGGHHYTYDSLGQQTQVDYGTAGTYTYDALGYRVRKDIAGGDYIEYNRFGGQSMAETRYSLGTWQDNIYANGQLVARDHSADTYIQFSGTNSTSGLYSVYYVPLPSGGVAIQNGAKLVWRQKQEGAAFPKGGIGVVTSIGTNLNWTAHDQDGEVINSDTTQNTWHNRVVDLSSIAGQTVSSMWLDEDVVTGAGAWTEYFADIAIVQPDGTTTTLYNNQTGQTYSGSSASGVSSPTFSENETWNYNIPAISTHYFLADHLGSSRMEFAGPGWPVWSEDYAPYGQEVSPTGAPEATSNIYKFTGYERDPETNIAAGTEEDYAQARYYSSAIQGRFMSPDPYAGSMDIANPQSFNRYTYAMNNPLKFVDRTGMDCSAADEAGDSCGNGIDGCTYNWGYGGPLGFGGCEFDASYGGSGPSFEDAGSSDSFAAANGFGVYTPGQELAASYSTYEANIAQQIQLQNNAPARIIMLGGQVFSVPTLVTSGPLKGFYIAGTIYTYQVVTQDGTPIAGPMVISEQFTNIVGNTPTPSGADTNPFPDFVGYSATSPEGFAQVPLSINQQTWVVDMQGPFYSTAYTSTVAIQTVSPTTSPITGLPSATGSSVIVAP